MAKISVTDYAVVQLNFVAITNCSVFSEGNILNLVGVNLEVYGLIGRQGITQDHLA